MGSPKAVEDAARMTLLYCLNTYKGDEKIKSFVWSLITPEEFGGAENVGKNHEGLSGPVPRGKRKSNKKDKDEDFEMNGDDEENEKGGKKKGGRKGKKGKDEEKEQPPPPPQNEFPEEIGWVSDEKYDMEVNLNRGFRRHLDRHNNKILLRLRLLFYVSHEILGPHAVEVNTPGYAMKDLPLRVPNTDGQPPTAWWDPEADKSLLVGLWRHGYERYSSMRMDPDLCFLERCGPATEVGEGDTGTPKLDEDDSTSNTPRESRASS